MILSKVSMGKYKLIVSPIHLEEINAITDSYERVELRERLKALGKDVKIDLFDVRKIAEELYALQFGIADAAHVAFAEYCDAEFISCDDYLIKKCVKHKIDVWCGNPVAFYEKEGLR